MSVLRPGDAHAGRGLRSRGGDERLLAMGGDMLVCIGYGTIRDFRRL